jgi:predicted nucleic acid-binding protein
MPDCCVLLATADGQAEAVLTFDDRLARAAEQRRVRVDDLFA